MRTAHARIVETFPRPRPRSRGFSLIELVVVVAVLAVLATLGVPAFVDLIASQRIQTVAADLHTSLMRARSEAIKQNADVTVAPSGNWVDGWVVSSAAGNLEQHGATKNVAIAGPASVIYRSNGRVSTGAGAKFNFSSSSTAAKRCVEVSLSGQPVVTKAACT